MDFTEGRWRRTGLGRFPGCLLWPFMILAIPVFLILVILFMAVMLALSIPTGFRIWRAVRRWRKARKEESEIIEGEYWVVDDEEKKV
ncbi:MAG: hypothetical protein NTU41_09245 [Chloroflexi bacterium]|nr:hypothetical protein [Chloroflexota bacterium]